MYVIMSDVCHVAMSDISHSTHTLLYIFYIMTHEPTRKEPAFCQGSSIFSVCFWIELYT